MDSRTQRPQIVLSILFIKVRAIQSPALRDRNRLLTSVLIMLGILLGTIVLDALAPAISLPDWLYRFITIFLGIFIQSVPFLLLGSVIAGLINEFVSAGDIARFFPKNKVLGGFAGMLLGLCLPVCECGVPVVRRLCQKGFPISAGISFLLAAPVINPIVIASTWVAFGNSPLFWGRIIFTLIIAFGVGLVFSVQPNITRVLLPRSLASVMGSAGTGSEDSSAKQTAQPGAFHHSKFSGFTSRMHHALGIAMREFLDVGRYLIIGILIATALQMLIPQPALVSSAQQPLASVIALQALAIVLSASSTVDAFIALSFVNTFTAGAIIAFLVFGPMLDIKGISMYLNLFHRRVVFYLAALTFLSALLAGVFINLNVSLVP